MINKVRALLYQASLPNYFWGEVLLASVFLYNRTPHTALKGVTPYEKKTGVKPDISFIRIFGSITFYKVKGLDSHNKLKARANKAVLIGYTDNAKVYKLWDIELRKVVYSRDVEIIEGNFYTFDNYNTEVEEPKSEKTELSNSDSDSDSDYESDSKEPEANKSPE